MTPPTVPKKPLGKYYAVVFRNPDFSFAKVGFAGALGGKHDFPRPDFGDLCVCCDRPAQGRKRLLDPSSEHFKTEAIPAPVCIACDDHAFAKTGSSIAAAMFMLSSGAGIGLGFMKDSMPVVGACALVFVACGFWLRALHRARVERTHSGHFPGLEASAHPGQMVVRTTNHRVAAEIVAKDPQRVFRVR